MSGTLQKFLTNTTQKAATDLEAALLRLPEDKRHWSAMDKARTALDMVAECAILNGSTATMIQVHHFDKNFDPVQFAQEKASLSQDWPAMQSLLRENTARVIAAVDTVTDADLAVEIAMPWGPISMAQLISYPYWNMSYHEGQINFIASMLGCLDQAED